MTRPRSSEQSPSQPETPVAHARDPDAAVARAWQPLPEGVGRQSYRPSEHLRRIKSRTYTHTYIPLWGLLSFPLEDAEEDMFLVIEEDTDVTSEI